jgi:hypothetical protein
MATAVEQAGRNLFDLVRRPHGAAKSPVPQPAATVR